MNRRQAIAAANLNGRKLGYQFGFNDGYDYAWREFAKLLEDLTKQTKFRSRGRAPATRRCHRCLKEG